VGRDQGNLIAAHFFDMARYLLCVSYILSFAPARRCFPGGLLCRNRCWLVWWQRGDESVQRFPILGGDGDFKLALQAFALDGDFPAAQLRAQIGSAPGLFSTRVQLYMPIRRSDYPQQLAFRFAFAAGHAGAHGNMLYLFLLRFCHLSCPSVLLVVIIAISAPVMGVGASATPSARCAALAVTIPIAAFISASPVMGASTLMR
jgi:hypothetical protein